MLLNIHADARVLIATIKTRALRSLSDPCINIQCKYNLMSFMRFNVTNSAHTEEYLVILHNLRMQCVKIVHVYNVFYFM